MLKELLKINPCYLILIILFWIVFMINLKKNKIKLSYRLIATGIYIIFNFFLFSYINGMILNIFKLKYLSVKVYLILVVLVNAIILFTLNKKIKVIYSILNYVLFIFTTIILGATIAIVLGNKYDAFYLMDVSNAVNFIDLSMVIFLLYLIALCLTNIGYYLFENKEEEEEKFNQRKEIILQKIKNIQRPKRKSKEKEWNMSLEELLHFDRKNTLYIHGEDCNIIFEDSNPNNIFTNYQILNHDITARMVNGYTLKENKMLRSICMKLQVNNLACIDMSNISILNKISIEEYKLLKDVFNIN